MTTLNHEEKKVSENKKYINLSENFFSIDLSGDWKKYRKVQLKSRLVVDDKIKVKLFFDGSPWSGDPEHVSLSYLIFEDPYLLEKLGTILIALSNSLEKGTTPEKIKEQLSRVYRNVLMLYQNAERAGREVLSDAI